MSKRSSDGESRSGLRLKAEAHRQRRTLVFVDESGFYLLPGKVRTYAPEGHTPVLHEWQTRDHLSVMGGVTLTGKLYVLVRQESLNGLHTIEFLKHLIRHIGPRLLVIWDGSPIHRRVAVKDFLASTAGRGVRVERLPPYAPDLNPVEGSWQHLKHVEMRNLADARFGRTPPGTSLGHRPLETKASLDSIVLCRGRAGSGKLKLAAQRSVWSRRSAQPALECLGLPR